MSLPETASTTETVWTVLALPGLLMSAYLVYGAERDLRYHWTDGLRPMGWVGLVKALAVLLLAALVIAAGVVAMWTPEPIRQPNQDASQIIAGILLVIDGLILALAVLLLIERAYVVPHIRTRDQQQQDRIERVSLDTNRRLQRSAIGDAEQQLVNKDQADEIQATGEAALDRLKREGIGDEPS